MFNGGLEYDKLKSYSAREIQLIHESLGEIRAQEEAAMNKSRKKG